MSSHLKAELAATCSTLGRFHKGEYFIESECIESVKDLIRYLKRDSESHEIRRHLGESKVLQNDLIHIVKSCPDDNSDLFDVTLRLLINLTTPTMLFYAEDIPTEKMARNIYLSLVGYSQDYKISFCDVEFWNKICGKLTDLFEIDWAERSADDGIQIERILMLLRNVLQVPADEESEKRPENDITVHDKVLWALRQSQILELLLFILSNRNEEQYYLNLLEIFSLILREQNPRLLAHCDVQRSAAEKNKEAEELVKVREMEKKSRNKYLNMRNFNSTFVVKGVKSLSSKDVVCHKSLDKVRELDLGDLNKKQIKPRKNRVPVESERMERRSSYSVRLFLKEFCLEFVSSSFNHFMGVVKNKLDSGKSLANDQTYYFWALKFFLDFATASNLEVDLIKGFLSSESFHYIHTSMNNAFDHLAAEKKKTIDWVKRIHLILKAYHSLLETLLWMDCSKNPITRAISREIKSQIFYVVDYREMTLHLLLRYDPTKFSVSYLRDLIETTHLFVKLLEEYSKQTKLVVQKITRKKSSKKKSKKVEVVVESREEKWEKIKDHVYDILCSENTFPEIPPFDAALDIPIDEQKGRAMKKIQKFLFEGKIREAIGFLRSARQVWPENDYFGTEEMPVEEETMALQEICLADLREVEGDEEKDVPKSGQQEEEEDDEDEEEEEENRLQIVEQDFDIMEYKKRLVNKKVVEGCGILLKNYKKNSDHTNHCVIKLLHRIGWECCVPAMLFQASIFWTLLKIMRDDSKEYKEINTFTVNLVRKFRKLAEKNPVIFLELLFWKEHNVAMEIQHGYEPYETKPKKGKKKKEAGDENGKKKKGRGRKKRGAEVWEGDVVVDESLATGEKEGSEESQSYEAQESSEDEHRSELPTPKNARNVSRVLFEKSDSDEDDSVNVSSNPNNEDLRKSNSKDERDEEEVADAVKHKTNKLRINESRDEKENWDEPKKPRETFESDREEEEKEEKEDGSGVKRLETGKESDYSSNSQTPNAPSKKRVRERKKESKRLPSDSDSESDNSKSKRIRCIGSESEDFFSEQEDQIPVGSGKQKKRKRRLAVIDSDSDVEANFLDEK